MSMLLYDGPQFSGRSKALAESTWAAPGGQYLHPLPDSNLSGLAQTVQGELRIHSPQFANATTELTYDLSPTAQLHSLSGGELARLTLATALFRARTRLGLDSTLEQLDVSWRNRAVEILKGHRSLDVAIVDNDADTLLQGLPKRRFLEAESAPPINTALELFASQLPVRSEAAPTIDLQNLYFAYPRTSRRIFDDASVTLEPGRIYILKGANGAGKSTLARILTGVLRPQRGRIYVDGIMRKLHRERVSPLFYAFQNPLAQIFGRTPLHYLNSLQERASRGAVSGRPTKLMTKEILNGFGLSSFNNDEIFSLPFVAQKRLSIAAALASGAPWLFFDEPSIGSDAKGRQSLLSFFEALSKSGYGVVLISHGTEYDRLPNSTQLRVECAKLKPGG